MHKRTWVAVAAAAALVVLAVAAGAAWRILSGADARRAELSRTPLQKRILGYWRAPDTPGDANQARIDATTIDYYEYPVDYTYDGVTLVARGPNGEQRYRVTWLDADTMVWQLPGNPPMRWVRTEPWTYDPQLGTYHP